MFEEVPAGLLPISRHPIWNGARSDKSRPGSGLWPSNPVRYLERPTAIVTKLGTRQRRSSHSSGSEAFQISSKLSIAPPTGMSCRINNTPGLRWCWANCRKWWDIVLKSWETRIRPSRAARASTSRSGTSSRRAAWALRKSIRGSLRTAQRTIDFRRSIVRLIPNLHCRGSKVLRRVRSRRACKSGLGGVPSRSNWAHWSLRHDK